MKDLLTIEEAFNCLNQLKTEFNKSYLSNQFNKHEELVNRLLDGAPYPLVYQYADTNFYRVREGDPNKLFEVHHFFGNKSDFFLNPDPKNIPLGRCNHKGVQVFYCAFEERTAQYEAINIFREANNSNVNTPHIAYIGRWYSRRVLNIANFSGKGDPLDWFKENDPDWLEFATELELFFRQLFSMPSNGNPAVYSLTATVAEKIMTRFDGIAYPSSITNGEGTSLAAKPELFLDESISFNNACRIRRDSYTGPWNRIDSWIGMVTDTNGTLLWMPSESTMLKALINKSSLPLAYKCPPASEDV